MHLYFRFAALECSARAPDSSSLTEMLLIGDSGVSWDVFILQIYYKRKFHIKHQTTTIWDSNEELTYRQ